MEDTTSRSEKSYIEASCEHNIRADGRQLLDARYMSIELDVLPQCNSSCRLSIGSGTDLMCSIKLEVSEPAAVAPTEGIVEVSVDFSPVVNLRMDKRRLQEHGNRVACQIQETLLSSGSIDLEKLCIIPAKICWVIHIDILFFQLDGSPVDAASYAAYIALRTARYPRSELIDGESGKPEDFELCNDIASACKLPISSRGLPIVVSIAQIGSNMVVDCDAAELGCAGSLVSLAFDDNGSCCGLRKEGAAEFARLSAVNDAIKIAGSFAKSILQHIEGTLDAADMSSHARLVHPEVSASSVGLLV